MRGAKHIVRHHVRVTWRCKHCRQVMGSENLSHYGAAPPSMMKPTWFFASMALLDHLRDCQKTDFSDTLRESYGADFLNHPHIWEWYNVHALVEREFIGEDELDNAGHG